MLSRMRAKLLGRSALLQAQARDLLAAPELSMLLGRDVVNLDTPELQRFLAGKRIMVTGAGGSIGSELCRQAARFCPERLVLVERSENALFEIDRELRDRWLGVDVRPCLADITEQPRVERLFAEHRPELVFHAAAHKHVPMMEANPGEAVRNNIFGTLTLVDVAEHAGVDAFVLISTDKAVNPTSVMGASKRVAEMIVASRGERRWTTDERDTSSSPTHVDRTRSLSLVPRPPSPAPRFTSVRFGNVIGSSGSVVPIFRRQIERGGPVTVTHPEMRRYFMTIPEATQLVMQAGAIGRGGEVMLLDMGEPVKILDLARQMIAQAGLREGRDIEIRFTGMRPGEKLFEELARHDQQTRPTSHAKIRVWDLPAVDAATLDDALAALRDAIDTTPEQAVTALARAVREFEPESHRVRSPAVAHAA